MRPRRGERGRVWLRRRGGEAQSGERPGQGGKGAAHVAKGGERTAGDYKNTMATLAESKATPVTCQMLRHAVP